MVVHDTANKLAEEIKKSEEYINYKMAKQAVNLNDELKKRINEFEKSRYNAQIAIMQTGKNDEEKTKKMQELYVELVQEEAARKYLDAETKFNTILSDVNKIIGDAIKDVIQ